MPDRVPAAVVARVGPILAVDGDCPRCLRLARLLWHVVARDRYEIRPYRQLGVSRPPGRHPVTWFADRDECTGGRALARAALAGEPRWRPVLVLLRVPGARRPR